MNFNRFEEITNLQQLKYSYDKIFKKKSIRESEVHYKWIKNLVAPRRGKMLLDIACGGGYFLQEAEKTGAETFGLDLSTAAIKIALEKAQKSNILCGAGENLPFKDNLFDYITNLGSLEHFLDPKKGLKEMARVLKKDGKAVLLLPNSFFLMTVWNVLKTGSTGRKTDQVVDRWATKEEWTKFIEENGLKVEEILKYNYKSPNAPLRYKLVRPFIPLNFSYCFVFVCSKS